MRCPICSDATLALVQLAPQLPAYACPHCAGVWIASSDYWAWLELPADAAPAGIGSALEAVAEPEGARRCAGCGHIQLRYPIARDLPFRLDQCGHCNSFWLDRHEWSVLHERGLHRRLHQITNGPGQRRLREEERRATWEQIYAARLGTEDYSEIQRVRAWLTGHPRQAMLLAYLSSPDPYNPDRFAN